MTAKQGEQFENFVSFFGAIDTRSSVLTYLYLCTLLGLRLVASSSSTEYVAVLGMHLICNLQPLPIQAESIIEFSKAPHRAYCCNCQAVGRFVCHPYRILLQFQGRHGFDEGRERGLRLKTVVFLPTKSITRFYSTIGPWDCCC